MRPKAEGGVHRSDRAVRTCTKSHCSGNRRDPTTPGSELVKRLIPEDRKSLFDVGDGEHHDGPFPFP
jgi:hypothetical protein